MVIDWAVQEDPMAIILKDSSRARGLRPEPRDSPPCTGTACKGKVMMVVMEVLVVVS
jgi:hypothetical protein